MFEGSEAFTLLECRFNPDFPLGSSNADKLGSEIHGGIDLF